jgi:hypothetical protein
VSLPFPLLPQRAIKCFHPKTLLRCVDQEVHALQVATSQGCKYVLGLEGMALLASSEQRLLAGLVLQHGDQTLWDQVRYGGRMQDEEELRAVLFQMLLGVYELHFHHVWHRDLSPANFLQFDAKPGMPFTHYDRQLMVIDLGASKLLDMLRTHQPVSVVFTPGFGAPEYVKGRDSHSGSKPGAQAAHQGMKPLKPAGVAAALCLQGRNTAFHTSLPPPPPRWYTNCAGKGHLHVMHLCRHWHPQARMASQHSICMVAHRVHG